jgi:uncharacterized protein (TIGR00251 family)
MRDGRLGLCIAAPATEGKANKALVAFLAGCLDLPPSRVVIVSGASNRYKTVQVEGFTEDEALHRLETHAS